jgi:lipoprotein-anchoring transpeptidase ErfK/SrfK
MVYEGRFSRSRGAREGAHRAGDQQGSDRAHRDCRQRRRIRGRSAAPRGARPVAGGRGAERAAGEQHDDATTAHHDDHDDHHVAAAASPPPRSPPPPPPTTTTPKPKPKPKPKPAVGAPCNDTARACIDLSANQSWLLQGGRVVYGPVPITHGRAGWRTPPGTFRVQFKNIDHKSSIFNNAPMPYSVFFNGGIAFHAGSLTQLSHGCIHLSNAAAKMYYNTLRVGDVRPGRPPSGRQAMLPHASTPSGHGVVALLNRFAGR